MVRWARFELARLSALPPQDSVSTDSTTSAKREKDGRKFHPRKKGELNYPKNGFAYRAIRAITSV